MIGEWRGFAREERVLNQLEIPRSSREGIDRVGLKEHRAAGIVGRSRCRQVFDLPAERRFAAAGTGGVGIAAGIEVGLPWSEQGALRCDVIANDAETGRLKHK